MCGLTGFLKLQKTSERDLEAALRAMTGSLAHRGPDDEQFHTDESAGLYLGFRRLAIQDLSEAGRQPMRSASGRFVMTFNGEVYNFAALREQLRTGGASFRGGSDTEVILEAFEAWGVERALTRFEGMFAIALWDSEARKLYLARDRLGIKPLYFLFRDGGVAWASEVRAFHHCPIFAGGGSSEAALRFLQRLYVPAPNSILEGVEKLSPGELMTVDWPHAGSPTRTRRPYWALADIATRAEPLTRDPYEMVEVLHAALREAVTQRLVADVPVGAFLSGGIDSSLVVALMQESSPQPVRTFTVGFSEAPSYNEAEIAESVARHLGCQHSTIDLPLSDVIDLVPTLPGMTDEPMANPSLLPTYLVSRYARRFVTVALSGDGGDECFAGYNRYRLGTQLLRATRPLPSVGRKIVSKLLEPAFVDDVADGIVHRLMPGRLGQQQSMRERLNKVRKVLGAQSPQGAYEALLNVGMSSAKQIWSARPGLFESTGLPLTSAMMLLDQLDYLPDDLLTKVDRASMGESLEARVPLLDHRVVELSWRISVEHKLQHGQSKWPLREIARRYLPAKILERPKMGFTVPIGQWLGGPLREWARDTLSTTRTKSSAVWNHVGVAQAWTEFESGREEHALPLYAAAILQGWSDAWGVEFS